jgi:hypothetical protein
MGVPDDTIDEDYAISAELLAPRIAELRAVCSMGRETTTSGANLHPARPHMKTRSFSKSWRSVAFWVALYKTTAG